MFIEASVRTVRPNIDYGNGENIQTRNTFPAPKRKRIGTFQETIRKTEAKLAPSDGRPFLPSDAPLRPRKASVPKR